MNEIADRLFAAGHTDRVREAGKFATLRAETLGFDSDITDLRWSPDDEHPANELFQVISDCEDANELSDIGDYIADLTDLNDPMNAEYDPNFSYDDDDDDDDIAA